MNGESNTVAIIIALTILVLAIIGTVAVVLFVVRRIRSIFSRVFSRNGRRTSSKGADSHTTRNAKQPKRTQSSTLPKVLADDEIARETPSSDLPPSRSLPGFHEGAHPDMGRKARVGNAERSTGWIPGDGNARVGGRNIGGMVYVGRRPRRHPGGASDNGFIDLRMNVSRRGGDYDGKGMGYWPDYSSISDRSRATYLDWLSGGRSDTGYNVGYVFLYFYGLEKRVFVDRTDPRERVEIVNEVRRLLEIYGHNHSVRRYLGAFVDATGLLEIGDDLQPIFEHDGYEVPATILVALGRMAEGGESLTADWLLSWYLCHPETRLRTPAKRAVAEFRAYFRHLFDREFPNGLRLRVPKRRLKLVYHAASGNFEADLSEYLGAVPDVSSLSSPLSTAQTIADKAASALDRYSRYLGRNPEGRGTVEAHALLPEALWPLFPCPEKEELRTWVASQIETGGLVPVEDVIERLEGARPDKLGKRQLTGVADALARLGIGMAPDPRYALRQPRFGEPVVLFHLPGGIVTVESPSEAYRSAIVSLAVGTLVAHSDGRIDASEREHLAGQIDANSSVTEAERARLHANLSWMAVVPPDMSMLRSCLRNATESARSALGQLAVAAAGVDGKIDAEEIRMIERLYAAMNLERERIYTDLHALSSAPEPVTVRRADPASREFAIPSPPRETPAGSVALDAARVSAVMADTVRVSRVLGDIFADDGDDYDDEDVVEGPASDTEDRFVGLDAPHKAVAAVLITRHRWTEDEVAALADEHQLMAAGALETINEWAFGSLGDALVEQYDGYEVNGDLAQELMR